MIKIKLKNNSIIFIAVLGLLLLAGCDKFKKNSAAPQGGAAVPVSTQKTIPQAVPPVTVQKPISSVKLQAAQTNQFDFSTKKDPFKPAIKTLAPAELLKKRGYVKDALPIHSFDISQFRLTGVVADVKGNKAMVVDPSGKAYVVKVGMTIGKNEGRITTITTSGVEVVEQFRDENNQIRKEIIRIPLLRKP